MMQTKKDQQRLQCCWLLWPALWLTYHICIIMTSWLGWGCISSWLFIWSHKSDILPNVWVPIYVWFWITYLSLAVWWEHYRLSEQNLLQTSFNWKSEFGLCFWNSVIFALNHKYKRAWCLHLITSTKDYLKVMKSVATERKLSCRFWKKTVTLLKLG